jgi:glycosyltransferase involved in cell wall biosynthesis
MPACNEERAIEAAVTEVQQHVFSRVRTAELIAVNDSSRDRTGEILDQLAIQDRRIRVIHQHNAGHGPLSPFGSLCYTIPDFNRTRNPLVSFLPVL